MSWNIQGAQQNSMLASLVYFQFLGILNSLIFTRCHSEKPHTI